MDMHNQTIIKSILNMRCREGTTIAEIEEEYCDLVGKPWPFAHFSAKQIAFCLANMENVYCVAKNGTQARWYTRSSHTQHLSKLIRQQKPVRPKRVLSTNSPNITIMQRPRPDDQHSQCIARPIGAKQTPAALPQNQSIHQILSRLSLVELPIDAQYVGDDFFLALSAMDENQPPFSTKKGTKQRSGTCMTGLTIAGATKLVQSTAEFRIDRLLINVGSTDILNGASLTQMCSDMNDLMLACKMRQVVPILSTLAPLASAAHSPDMQEQLMAFNSYISDTFMRRTIVIDIWTLMNSAFGQTLFQFYNSFSEPVSGGNLPCVLWNEKGRKRVHNHIQKSLSKALGKKSVYLG